MATTRNVFGQLIEIVWRGDAHQVKRFFSPQEVAKATRRFKFRKGERHVEILFSIGKPNYRERRFIKRVLEQDKNPFPIIQFTPAKRSSAKARK